MYLPSSKFEEVAGILDQRHQWKGMRSCVVEGLDRLKVLFLPLKRQ